MDNCGNLENRPRSTTVADLAEDLFQEYRIVGRQSLRLTEQRWRKHLAPVFSAMAVASVGTRQLNDYIERRRIEGAQNGTINRELAALRRMFVLGSRSLPRKVRQMPVFPRLRENPPRKGFLDDAGYAALLRNARWPWLRTLLALAYSFGWRKAELLDLRVRQADLLGRTLRLDPGSTKNGDGRLIFLTEETFLLVSAMASGKTGEDYLLTRGGKRISDFRQAWAGICTVAGLGERCCAPCRLSAGNLSHCPQCKRRTQYRGLIFHDLRRAAVRNMVRRGVPERVAMAISGHRTRSVFDRYNIVSESDLRQAALRIEAGRDRHVDQARLFEAPGVAGRQAVANFRKN